MFSEDDLLPISALQHLQFCERQWGLIHLEQQWEENRLTAEGRVLHDRVHESGTEARPGVVIARRLHLHSLRLGLTGQADVVEFHAASEARTGPPLSPILVGNPPGAPAPGGVHPLLVVRANSSESVAIPGRPGLWRPFPVEYKRGKPKADSCDEVQLCAQALCLEEMFGATIDTGALFYGTNRRRTEVAFDSGLRKRTEDLAGRMHQLWSERITPPAAYSKKCENCSLYNRCLPRMPAKRGAVSRYLTLAWKDSA